MSSITSPYQANLPYQTDAPFTKLIEAKSRAATTLQARIRGHQARNHVILPSHIVQRLNVPMLNQYTDEEKLGLLRAICWEINEMKMNPTKFNGFSKFVAPAVYHFKEESPANSTLKFEVVRSLCNEMNDMMTNIKKYHIDIEVLEKDGEFVRNSLHADISQKLCLEMNDLANDPKKWGRPIKSSVDMMDLNVDKVHHRDHLKYEYEMSVSKSGNSIALMIKNPSNEVHYTKVKFKIITLHHPFILIPPPHQFKITRIIQPLTKQQLGDFKLSLSNPKIEKTIPQLKRTNKSISTCNLRPIELCEGKKSIFIRHPYFLEMEKSGIVLTILDRKIKDIPGAISHDAISLNIPYHLNNQKREGTTDFKIIRTYSKNYPHFDSKKIDMQKIMRQIAESHGGYIIENERPRLPDASIETFFEELGEEWKKTFHSSKNAKSLPASTKKKVKIGPPTVIKKQIGREKKNSLNHLETIQDPRLEDLLSILSKNADHPSRLSLNTYDLIHYFLDIASTMIPQHENGIVHGNLNPRNIFLKAKHDGKMTAYLDSKSANYMGFYLPRGPNFFLDTSTREGYLTPFTDCYSLAITLLCTFFQFKNDKFLNSINKHFDKSHVKSSKQLLMNGIVEQVIEESALSPSDKQSLKKIFDSKFWFSKKELNLILSDLDSATPEDKLTLHPNNRKNGDLDSAKGSESNLQETGRYYDINEFLKAESRELSPKPKTNFSDSLAISEIIQQLHIYRKIFDLIQKIIQYSNQLKNQIDKNENFIKLWKDPKSTLEEKQNEFEEINKHLCSIKLRKNPESNLEEKQIEIEEINKHLYLMPKIKIKLEKILKLFPQEIS